MEGDFFFYEAILVKVGIKMKLAWTPFAEQYFTKADEKEAFKEEIIKKIPTFIANHYFRIKPIRLLMKKSDYPLFELRMHIGKRDYRVAFAEIEDRKVVCYISSNLQKEGFEKEMNKWIKKNPQFLSEEIEIQ